MDRDDLKITDTESYKLFLAFLTAGYYRPSMSKLVVIIESTKRWQAVEAMISVCFFEIAERNCIEACNHPRGAVRSSLVAVKNLNDPINSFVLFIFFNIFPNLPTPMKFTPTNQNFVFEPISTPNKNIQSYFMRNEQSFFTPEALKYPSYIDNQVCIRFFVGNNFFYIHDIKIEQDCIVNDRFNVKKYGTRQKCIDELYTIFYNEIKKKNDSNSQDLPEKDNNNECSLSQDISSTCTAISKDMKLQLITSDFLCRSDIISLIDVFLNLLGFKCLMLLPFSLCLSFNLNQCYSAYIHKNGFSFIDDFCLLDTYEYYVRNEAYEKTMVDDLDFAEEYSRLNVLGENMIYSCDECGIKEDTEEKIVAHSFKDHSSKCYFRFEKTDSFHETFKSRMRYLFKKENLEKISTKVYSVESDLPGAQRIDNAAEQALAGAKIFSNLEISKELWMTDCEWRIARLRILKEKLLFYI